MAPTQPQEEEGRPIMNVTVYDDSSSSSVKMDTKNMSTQKTFVRGGRSLLSSMHLLKPFQLVTGGGGGGNTSTPRTSASSSSSTSTTLSIVTTATEFVASTTTSKKTVTFATTNENDDNDTILELIYDTSIDMKNKPLSTWELQTCWYQINDIQRIHSFNGITVNRLETGIPELEPFCYRGLETKQQHEQKMNYIRSTIQAVLNEQQQQQRHRHRNEEKEESFTAMEMAIAQVYQTYTKSSRLDSCIVGVLDEEEAQEYYDNNNTSSSSSSSMMIRRRPKSSDDLLEGSFSALVTTTTITNDEDDEEDIHNLGLHSVKSSTSASSFFLSSSSSSSKDDSQISSTSSSNHNKRWRLSSFRLKPSNSSSNSNTPKKPMSRKNFLTNHAA